ncbi:MAG: GNAT family N-acetyltransferase [Verrucomicrobiaceae bacterium]
MVRFFAPDFTNAQHREALISLMNEYASGITGGGEGLPEETKRNLVTKLAARPSCHLVLAMDNDFPVGVAICFEAFSTFACLPILNIHDFAITAAYRGRGLAKGLMSEVEKVARSLGCCKITLEVLEGNTVAKHVYEQYGFQGYELDPAMGQALFMEKKL